jgi:transmembrane sensor
MLLNQSDIAEDPHDTALAWIARFRSDFATDEDRKAFILWLSQSPAHKLAMDSMLDMWADLGCIKQLYSQSEITLPKRSANNASWLSVGAASAACLALALVFWPNSTQHSDLLRFQTAVGEQRTVELEDNSTLILNTNSQVTVQYSSERRSLKLIGGEVYFTVAKDAARPFEVDAGSAKVTALGTAFNIRRQGEHTSIAVAEGVVRIAETAKTGTRPMSTEILHADQQLDAGPQGLSAAAPADLQLKLAWQRGELVARDMSLSALTKEIERYHDVHIILTDARVASLTLSGVFAIADLDPILEAVQLTLGLEMVSIDANTLQLLKPSQ